jgi:ATP-dependent RNA helicase DDX49/DBP8
MTGEKRKRLTTDELMRLQELQSKRKRPLKNATVLSEDEHEDSAASDSGSELGAHYDNSSEEDKNGYNEGHDDDLDVGPNKDDVEEFALRNSSQSSSWLEDNSDSRMLFQQKLDSSQTPTLLNKNAPTFVSLGISSTLISAMSGMAIRTPTEIQAACIPPLLAGKHTVIFVRGT